MISIFYAVSIVAILALALLFYILFRRRISFRIFHAKGYLGMSSFALIFFFVLASSLYYAITTNTHAEETILLLAEDQREDLNIWLEDYERQAASLSRSYQATHKLMQELANGEKSLTSGLLRAEQLLAELQKEYDSLAAMPVAKMLPDHLKEHMSSLISQGRARYTSQLTLLKNLCQLLKEEREKQKSSAPTSAFINKLETLHLTYTPAYRDTVVKLQDIRDDMRTLPVSSAAKKQEASFGN